MVGAISAVMNVNRTTQVKPVGQKTEIPSEKQAITPVARTASVQRERINPVDFQLPTREGADPEEVAVRGRIAAYEETQLQKDLQETRGELAEVEEEIQEEKIEKEPVIECECCKNRKYVDGSDDGSVSYQTPTHISPETSASKVMAHEQEHVTNEQVYAERDGREVVSQTVRLDSAVCPECGVSYTSGGLTTTVTADKRENFTISEQNKDDMMSIVAS